MRFGEELATEAKAAQPGGGVAPPHPPQGAGALSPPHTAPTGGVRARRARGCAAPAP